MEKQRPYYLGGTKRKIRKDEEMFEAE